MVRVWQAAFANEVSSSIAALGDMGSASPSSWGHGWSGTRLTTAMVGIAMVGIAMVGE